MSKTLVYQKRFATEKEANGWIQKQGLSFEGDLPWGTVATGRGIELQLYGSLQDLTDDYLNSLTGAEAQAQVINDIRILVNRWSELNQEAADKAFDKLFKAGFRAGSEGKIGTYDERALQVVKDGTYRIGNRIKLFGDQTVEKFAKTIGGVYEPDGTFSVEHMIKEMNKEIPAQRYALERIARTETGNVTSIGRIHGWSQDDDKYFYNYRWNSLPDSKRREMKKIRSNGNPYSYKEIAFLWMHNAQNVPGIGMQMGVINCRCTISRSPRDDEFRSNRFEGREHEFQKTADFPIDIVD